MILMNFFRLPLKTGMRLFHPGNCLRFLKHPRISQTHLEGNWSLTLRTTGSHWYYSKCKHTNTCFGFVQNTDFPLLNKWEMTSNHLGLKTFNSVLKYSTVNEDDLGKDAIVKDILKDIKDDFDKEFKQFVEVEEGEPKTLEHSKAEISDGLSVSSTNLSEMNDDASSGILRNSKDIPSSPSVFEDVLLIEEEEDDDDIEDFIDYGYTADDEEDIDVQLYSPPIELKRGTTGVFDIEDLVTVLEDENGIDICVIDVPKSKNYVDYMVIVSGKSARHIKSMAENIRWLYKQKKHKSDPFVQIEGLNTNNWFAMDLGNIALHIFLPQLREKYDLETLWTIGDVPDDETILELDDPYAMKELPTLETNEEVIAEKEAKNASSELKVEDNNNNNNNLIRNLSNKN